MPRWQRAVHNFAFGFMCLLCGGLLVLSVRFLLPVQGAVATKGQIVGSLMMMAISALMLGMQIHFRRRIIREFSYDGQALRFRTLGIPIQAIRQLAEIAEISEWRGRRGVQGYKIRLRDRQTIYLQSSVTNSVAAAAWIWKDLGH